MVVYFNEKTFFFQKKITKTRRLKKIKLKNKKTKNKTIEKTKKTEK